VCLGVLSFVDGRRQWKIQTLLMMICCVVFLSTMRNEWCTPASNAPKSRCLEGSLIVFNSGYSEVPNVVADHHLPCKLPVSNQHYFLHCVKT